MPHPHGIGNRTLGAQLDTALARRGAGARLVDWALEYVATIVALTVGGRFVTLDALYDPDTDPHYDVSGYYERFGFQLVNPEESLPPKEAYRTMYLDIKPFIDIIREAEAKADD